MLKWVLIIMMSSNAGEAITVVDFETETLCQKAADEVSKSTVRGLTILATCHLRRENSKDEK